MTPTVLDVADNEVQQAVWSFVCDASTLLETLCLCAIYFGEPSENGCNLHARVAKVVRRFDKIACNHD